MSYCVKCGAALAADASFCASCGTPVGTLPAPASAPASLPAPGVDPNAPSLGIAITALILNIIVWPGLGTLIAGDRKGWTQGFLFLLGFALIFTFIGIAIPLMIGMWVWGIVSGVQLIERANAKERAMQRAPPA